MIVGLIIGFLVGVILASAVCLMKRDIDFQQYHEESVRQTQKLLDEQEAKFKEQVRNDQENMFHEVPLLHKRIDQLQTENEQLSLLLQEKDYFRPF